MTHSGVRIPAFSPKNTTDDISLQHVYLIAKTQNKKVSSAVKTGIEA